MKKPQPIPGIDPAARATGVDRAPEPGDQDRGHPSQAHVAMVDAVAPRHSGERRDREARAANVSGEAGPGKRQRHGMTGPGDGQAVNDQGPDAAGNLRAGDAVLRSRARAANGDAVLRRVAEVLDGIDEGAPSPAGREAPDRQFADPYGATVHTQAPPERVLQGMLAPAPAADVMVLRAGLEDCLCHLAELYGVEILDAFLARRLQMSVAPIVDRAAAMDDPVMRRRTEQHAAAAERLLRETVAAVRRDPTPPED